jgi:hypothetical protein
MRIPGKQRSLHRLVDSEQCGSESLLKCLADGFDSRVFEREGLLTVLTSEKMLLHGDGFGVGKPAKRVEFKGFCGDVVGVQGLLSSHGSWSQPLEPPGAQSAPQPTQKQSEEQQRHNMHGSMVAQESLGPQWARSTNSERLTPQNRSIWAD